MGELQQYDSRPVGPEGSSVADPSHFSSDPDPAFHFEAALDSDPDPSV